MHLTTEHRLNELAAQIEAIERNTDGAAKNAGLLCLIGLANTALLISIFIYMIVKL